MLQSKLQQFPVNIQYEAVQELITQQLGQSVKNKNSYLTDGLFVIKKNLELDPAKLDYSLKTIRSLIEEHGKARHNRS